MGKKSLKGKEKKLKRKEEILKLNEAALAVKNADAVENPLESLTAFQKYTRNGLELSIQCKRIQSLSSIDFESVFDLVKTNMESLYEGSSWGWNEKSKREEMCEENARYLLAYDAEDKVVAMSHFRFDVDEDIEVLYCYEVQLSEEVRRKGLGKFLMQILELMAMKSRMKKVILTVFKANTHATNFFTKMKYGVDETSPSLDDIEDVENYDYEILSKHLMIK